MIEAVIVSKLSIVDYETRTRGSTVSISIDSEHSLVVAVPDERPHSVSLF